MYVHQILEWLPCTTTVINIFVKNNAPVFLMKKLQNIGFSDVLGSLLRYILQGCVSISTYKCIKYQAGNLWLGGNTGTGAGVDGKGNVPG